MQAFFTSRAFKPAMAQIFAGLVIDREEMSNMKRDSFDSASSFSFVSQWAATFYECISGM